MSDFLARTPQEVVLAIFDKLGIKLAKVNIDYNFYE